jgi:hypothetical protein
MLPTRACNGQCQRPIRSDAGKTDAAGPSQSICWMIKGHKIQPFVALWEVWGCKCLMSAISGIDPPSCSEAGHVPLRWFRLPTQMPIRCSIAGPTAARRQPTEPPDGGLYEYPPQPLSYGEVNRAREPGRGGARGLCASQYPGRLWPSGGQAVCCFAMHRSSSYV